MERILPCAQVHKTQWKKPEETLINQIWKIQLFYHNKIEGI